MRTFLLAGIMTAAVAAPAAAVDVNCLFPNPDNSCQRSYGYLPPYEGSEGYYDEDRAPVVAIKSSGSGWRQVGVTPDGWIIEMKPATPWTGAKKNVVSKKCSLADQNGTIVFGVCPELGESVGVTYRVRPTTVSKSYGLGAVNHKPRPSVDDWRDAFGD